MTMETNSQKIAAIQKCAALLKELGNDIELIEQTETILTIIEKNNIPMMTSTALRKIISAAELLSLSFFIDVAKDNTPAIKIFAVLLSNKN